MSLIQDTQSFLRDLSQNNSRDWFLAHKSHYESHLKSPALVLLDQLSADLERLCDTKVTPKLFRPHRDVRFSKDKTPYHTHLHMLWALQSGPKPAFFFGISPDDVTVGGGMMGFDKTQLTDWRAEIDQNGQSWADMIAPMLNDGWRQHDPDLKRVPAPFDKDHPQGDLLRRKSLTLWKSARDLDDLLPSFTELNPVLQNLVHL